jgi:hypothetical protein
MGQELVAGLQEPAFGRSGFESMRVPPLGLFSITPKRFCGLVLRDFKRTLFWGFEAFSTNLFSPVRA